MDINDADNAIERANETLEGILEGVCSWFVSKVETIKEKQAQKEEPQQEEQG